MYIWDINPGYLNDEDLIDEYRTIQAIDALFHRYSTIPPNLSFLHDKRSILSLRKALIIIELKLRNLNLSTIVHSAFEDQDPPLPLIESPDQQLEKLKHNYRTSANGRIPIPLNAQQLWAQHKYSIMARDPNLYIKIGQNLANSNDKTAYKTLIIKFVQLLRSPPQKGTLVNALQHMWGYVADFLPSTVATTDSPVQMLNLIQHLSKEHSVKYLLHSTAICELEFWVQPDNDYPWKASQKN